MLYWYVYRISINIAVGPTVLWNWCPCKAGASDCLSASSHQRFAAGSPTWPQLQLGWTPWLQGRQTAAMMLGAQRSHWHLGGSSQVVAVDVRNITSCHWFGHSLPFEAPPSFGGVFLGLPPWLVHGVMGGHRQPGCDPKSGWMWWHVIPKKNVFGSYLQNWCKLYTTWVDLAIPKPLPKLHGMWLSSPLLYGSGWQVVVPCFLFRLGFPTNLWLQVPSLQLHGFAMGMTIVRLPNVDREQKIRGSKPTEFCIGQTLICTKVRLWQDQDLSFRHVEPRSRSE